MDKEFKWYVPKRAWFEPRLHSNSPDICHAAQGLDRGKETKKVLLNPHKINKLNTPGIQN